MKSFALKLMLVASAASAGCVDDPSAPPSLDGRVTLVNTTVSVGGKALSPHAAPQAAPTFAYVASVSSPAIGDLTVQATNFAVHKDRGYVVYNTAGEDLAGGLEVLDLSDPDAPRLVASLIDTTAEFSDVAFVKDHVYAVGSDELGAILRVWDVKHKDVPVEVATLRLDAQYGTSITIGGPSGKTAYATFGANAGLAELDISDPDEPTVTRAVAIPNALYVVRVGANNLVLYGDTALAIERERAGALTPLATLAPTPIEAPGRMAVRGDQLYVNAGKSGLTRLAIHDGGASVTVLDHAAVDGTGNGLGASDELVFLAQGEAGIQVFTRDGTPQLLGEIEFPETRGSANQVLVGDGNGPHQKHLLISHGLEGFRILSFTE